MCKSSDENSILAHFFCHRNDLFKLIREGTVLFYKKFSGGQEGSAICLLRVSARKAFFVFWSYFGKVKMFCGLFRSPGLVEKGCARRRGENLRGIRGDAQIDELLHQWADPLVFVMATDR